MSVHREVKNHKYWQRLRPVETAIHSTVPTKEAIIFEKRLQQLEQENRMFEMGLAMRRASISTNKEAVCSIDAVRESKYYQREMKGVAVKLDAHWYLTKDLLVDDDTDRLNDCLLASVTKPSAKELT